MQTEEYRECLKDGLKNLTKANILIYGSLVSISMAGELKEWNDSVPVGEIHNFDFDLFKNCEDTNVQLLVKLIEKVEETYQALSNVNRIEMEEEDEE